MPNPWELHPYENPNPLHPKVASWPFEMWGTYIIGPIEPSSYKGHRFCRNGLYFSRWAEAIPLREVRAEDVVKFFK